MTCLSIALTPKNGHSLEVLAVCRVSCPGEGKQDIRSLEDQEALLRKWLDEHTEHHHEITVIAGSGSGENLERAEHLQLLNEISTERYDLVITEDMSRIARRVQAHMVCEQCIDCNTRLIAINDRVDTAVEGWEDASIMSTWHHTRSNRDTSDRIKRAHRNRFKSGGCVHQVRFGYIKPADTKSDQDVVKDPTAEPYIREWFRKLDEEGASYSSIADWLNKEGVSPGPSRRKTKWDCRMVATDTHNPWLKGVRERNRHRSKRNYTSGKYVCEEAPPELLLTREVPHLAYFDAAYYDRVVRAVDARNASYRRRDGDGKDHPTRGPKKRTRYPGQCVYCGICGNMYVFGGHGQKDHLMCDGARNYECWNGVSIDGPLANEKLTAAVMAEIEKLKDFDDAFRQLVAAAAAEMNRSSEQQLQRVETELQRIGREMENVVSFIRSGRASPTLSSELERLESEKAELLRTRDELERQRTPEPALPSASELTQLARDAFSSAATNSFEFADKLRKLAPRIVVFPYRLCDGGAIVLRAKFQLLIGGLLTDKQTREILNSELEKLLEVDLYDPPQREQHRLEVVARRVTGELEAKIAMDLGLTKTAVQQAASLQRKMDSLGITDSYVAVTKPDEDMGRMKRHRHPRYSFSPKPNAGVV